MNYLAIEKTSLVNGDGIRCVLWVAGCNHKCKNCQNPSTWDPDAGKRFYAYHYWDIIAPRVSQDYCDGLTLSGGDPMYPANRVEILALCRMFREDFSDRKTIWMYTGYAFEEIKDEPVLEYLDVIVDGPYIEEQRNVNRQWCGSENQRIWRKVNGLWFCEEPRYAEGIESGKECYM